MSDELFSLIKGVFVGVGIIGAGGILIDQHLTTGVVLLLISLLGLIVLKKVWNTNE
jgi:hypothetical protein